MTFNWNANARQAFTDRVRIRTRESAVAYQAGNRESEDEVQANRRYSIAQPDITIGQASRNRAGTGALDDFAAQNQDSAGLTWLWVEVLANRNFFAQIDQRDLSYVSPITLATLTDRMSEESTRWLDNALWTKVIGDIAAGQTTTLAPAGGVTMSRATQKLAGGTAAQQLAVGEAIYTWFGDLALAIANANLDPAVGDGDTAIPQVVSPVGMLAAVEAFLLDKYDNTDEIVLRGIEDPPSVGRAGRWRGRLKGIDWITSNANRLRATANAAAAGTAANGQVGVSNVFSAVAYLPGRSWDNALATYPLAEDAPDSVSAKHRFRQEFEVWARVIEGDYTWLLTLPSSA